MQEIPFFHDLTKPPYPLDVCWRDGAETPRRDEVAMTSDWVVMLPADASEQVRLAASDLRAFLADGGVDVRVAGDGRKARERPTIRLCRGRGVKGVPESYSLRVRSDRITISGADDSGIMYGIFYLEDLLRFRRGPYLTPGTERRAPALRTRILRSPLSFFHRRELPTVLEAYPDHLLVRLAHHGFNGIWLRGRLRELVKVDVFPEFGSDSDAVLADLNTLVRRAARFGIRVYMYFNEPLALPQDSGFFDKYPQIKGQPNESEKVFSMCTSTPEVQEFLRAGMEYLFSRVPDLAGVILISASEFHTHCFSHLSTRNRSRADWESEMRCDRCRQRTPEAVIGEVVQAIYSGVKAGNPAAEVIAWNWSWTLYEDDPQERVIRALPEGVGVMADFERGGARVTDGFRHTVDEYSLTYVGPSERFAGTAAVAGAEGRALYTKLQIGTTHEIATVPYFPVYFNLARKFLRLRRAGVVGAMESWNFGNLPSPNTEIAHWFSWSPAPRSIETCLAQMAARDFGAAAAPGVLDAWRLFSQSARHYPFSIPLLYWGPQHFGPAFPLYFRQVDRHMPIPWLLPAEVTYDTAFSWMDYTEFGDRIENYLGPFTAAQLVACFDRLLREWRQGYECLKQALRRVPRRLKPNAGREETVAGAVLSQFETVRNVTEFTALRDRYWQGGQRAREQKAVLRRLLAIATAEIKNAQFCKGLAQRNGMLGFHGEAFGYDYTPAKIEAKIAIVRQAIREIRAAIRRRDSGMGDGCGDSGRRG